MAASTTVAMTAAAPPMSEVMWCMLAAGLIEMPPVSNVMPLPTSATFLAFLPLRPAVNEPDQTGRARRTLADADHPAVAVLGERLLVEHLDFQAAASPKAFARLANSAGRGGSAGC